MAGQVAGSIETAMIYHNERFSTRRRIPPEMPADSPNRKIVFLTAGAAGMFCGSCMHDNAIAKELIASGNECLLQPIYTPIRTDGLSIAADRIFFGGIHVYAMQKFPWMKALPTPLRRLIDSPWLLRIVTRKASATDPNLLGDLTVSMLQGTHGRQASEVERLTDWIAREIQPDAIVLSNLLIGGFLPAIRSALPNAKIAVMLQGDDIFLEHLPQPQQTQAIKLCRSLVRHVDHFISNSQFYSNKMGELLAIDRIKRHEIPLSIDTSPFANTDTAGLQHTNRFDLGYMARITPDKGLHQLVDAFVSTSDQCDTHLHVAGWLGDSYRGYFDDQKAKIEKHGLNDRFTHHGSPSLEEKIAFLSKLDLLCVPTEYEEPKGLFVLEALAAGTPVLQPDHGAFGELIESTGGGKTFTPGDHEQLSEVLRELTLAPNQLRKFAETGRANVLARHHIQPAAENLLRILFTQ